MHKEVEGVLQNSYSFMIQGKGGYLILKINLF